MDIDYKGMADFFHKSERTLRRWEKEKPAIFAVMKNQFENEKSSFSGEVREGCTPIIMAVSAKGGVGKSTICDAFGEYLGDAVILNLDFLQPASMINACDTIDYIEHMNDKSIGEMISELSEQYRYIIIDTPGESTPEVLDALEYANKLIIPMTVGSRTQYATESTLHTFFGEGSTLDGDYDVFFFFNNYPDRNQRDAAAKTFMEDYKSFTPKNTVTIRPKLGALDTSRAIFTAETNGKSVFALAQENRAAYGIAAKKLTTLCSQIEEHFQLN